MGGLVEIRHRANGTAYTYTRQVRPPWRITPEMEDRMRAAVREEMTRKEQRDAAVAASGVRSRDRAVIVRKWVKAQGFASIEDMRDLYDESGLRVRSREMLGIMARAARKMTPLEDEDSDAGTA